MTNEEKILQTLEVMSKELNDLSTRQKEDREQQREDKKEIMVKFSSMENSNTQNFSNVNNQLTSINNTLSYERIRIDEIHNERKSVQVNWSTKMMGLNSAFAGIVAFMVSSFK